MGTCGSVGVASGDVFVEEVVCRDNELANGEVKEFKLEGSPCILVRDESGAFHALSSKCTHYGANLAKGAYSNGVIRCPWHGACFNVASGDIEDFPGLDSLHKFDVDVSNEGEVKVRAKKSALGNVRRMKNLVGRDQNNNETIVVLGGGGAAQASVETLRHDGQFTGRIIMVTKEDCLPYDRPKLSKALGSSAEQLQLRPKSFFDDADIEVMTGNEAVKVDTQQKEVVLKSDEKVHYDRLILATGSSPRTMGVEGSELKNIFIVRSPNEANVLAEAGKGKNVVIIGTSFIGMEVAAFFSDKAAKVTVIGNSSLPFEKSLGKDVGSFLKSLHEEKGNNFIMEDTVERFVGNSEGSVAKVVLKNNGTLENVDVVVLGIGTIPNTQFLDGSGIELNSRGFVKVNKHMETSAEGVFAAGDIAAFPLSTFSDEEVSIGHWQLAMSLGRCAALNAASQRVMLKTVPFFWTQQFGKSIRFTGYNVGFEETLVDGDISAGDFVVWYLKDGVVVAVATLNRDPVAAKFANSMLEGKSFSKEEIQSKL